MIDLFLCESLEVWGWLFCWDIFEGWLRSLRLFGGVLFVVIDSESEREGVRLVGFDEIGLEGF